MKVREDDVLDRKAVLAGVVYINGDVALRVDDGGDFGFLIRQHVRGVG